MSTNIQPVDLMSPGANLEAYIQAVNTIPLLSVEEEKELAEKLYYDADLDGARRLVMSHLRFVVYVAKSYSGYGLSEADLIQEGNVGLMKAVKRFDHDRDVRLVSFAVHWIKSEIYDYVVRNWRMVKVATTKAQRKLFFNLRKNRARLGVMKQAEVESMAEALDVKPETVREMETRMSGGDVAFEADVEDDDTPRSLAPADAIGDTSLDPGRLIFEADEANDRARQLRDALSVLDDRSRSIIKARWLGEREDKLTLSDLADKYGVSAERIRQIEKRAMEQMRTTVSA